MKQNVKEAQQAFDYILRANFECSANVLSVPKSRRAIPSELAH